MPTKTGPLAGLRILEFASLAPAPFACMVLSDLGAEVLRVDRPASVRDSAPSARDSVTSESAAPTDPTEPGSPRQDPLARGRRSVAIDLKNPRGAAAALRLAERADVLVEGFRPGVCERLGIGPSPCIARNPSLIYARLTGYGQDGPLAGAAGHDINYLALAGALEPLGPADGPPLPPLNYVADFGGGGMLLVVGILAALWERERSGRGQIVDAAMVEGAALITSLLHGLRASGMWHEQRGGNLFDGSAPFYATYQCADGGYVAIGAIEPRFWGELLHGLGLADAADRLPGQYDRARWPELRARIAAVFKTRTRDDWAAHFAGSDACVTPVLSPFVAHEHPHNLARGTFVEVAGLRQPAPAPRFSRTPGSVSGPSPHPGEHTDEALGEWGLSRAEIEDLRNSGAIR